MFYFEKEKKELCKIVKLEEMTLRKDHVFFGHGNVQSEGGVGRKGNDGQWYHMYLITENLDFKDVVGLANGDLMQRNGLNKR